MAGKERWGVVVFHKAFAPTRSQSAQRVKADAKSKPTGDREWEKTHAKMLAVDTYVQTSGLGLRHASGWKVKTLLFLSVMPSFAGFSVQLFLLLKAVFPWILSVAALRTITRWTHIFICWRCRVDCTHTDSRQGTISHTHHSDWEFLHNVWMMIRQGI